MSVDHNNNMHMDTLELDPADGQHYILELRDKLLDTLAPAQTIDEVEITLKKLYPDSRLVDLAIKEANKQRAESKSHKQRHSSSSSSASFTGALQNLTSFAVAKVSNLVRDGIVMSKAENELSKFKIALIQFILDDVLNLAGNFVKCQKGNFIITRSDIRTAMHADKDLMDMFLSDDKNLSIMVYHPKMNNNDKSQPMTTYKQKIRSMVDCENSFIRGLQLILKVFKAQLEGLPQIKREVQIIFCNIEQLYELSTSLLTVLEDALESVGQEDELPYVGTEILELAQAEEFHTYFTFAEKRLSGKEGWNQAFLSIVSKESIMTSIRTAGQSFDLAVRYLLPNYLFNTIFQFFKYYRDINDLHELVRDHNNSDDRRALRQSISILMNTKVKIETLLESEMKQMNDIELLESKQAETIQTMLERRLDAELQHERNLPLPYMPPQDLYRFSEPDSKDNIIFEEFHADEIPVIRYATLIKLVERLTFHKYQPNIVESFLTTYRSFISDPMELLELLIERFKIPDPPFFVVYPNFLGSPDDLPPGEQTFYKQYIKRFRQEYSKPVKMRVINVLKSWIRNHYYDFERSSSLLERLDNFLDEVYHSEKVLRSLIVSIKKSIDQKKISQHDEFEFMLSREPPAILWWTAKPNESDKFDILTLHPVEFARQLTIIEFDLFRAIKPSELINVKDLYTKTLKDNRNHESSPNLSRLTRHFTLFSYWIRKCIVETDDFDKRSAIYNRSIEIMAVLRDLNNHTGLLSIGSAIESAPLSRLIHTKKTLSSTLAKVMEDYRELNDNHQKKLQDELKRCNPPCIPYLGSYQTKLIHAKEGNKTFINQQPDHPPQNLINFYKQRMRAGLVAEITNYQNPPYCLRPQREIIQYIESIETEMVQFALSIDPEAHNCDYWAEPSVPQMTKRLDDYLFELSERIEPKNCMKPPRSKSKLPECWKSPGIKTH